MTKWRPTRHRYSSDNTTLALAGAVDFDAAVALAEDLQGMGTNPARTDLPGDQPHEKPSTVEIPSLSQAYLLMLSEAPSSTSEDRYLAGMVSHTLGGRTVRSSTGR